MIGATAPANTVFELRRQWLKHIIPDYIKQCSTETCPRIEETGVVGIIGAGMSGLYAAMILDSLGIQYKIFEANNRPGGRVYTHHFTGQWGAKDDYYDVGAMRFPAIPTMDRVIGDQDWSLIKKLKEGGENPTLNLKEYVLTAENNILYFNNQRVKVNMKKDYLVEDPLSFAVGGMAAVPKEFAEKNYYDWLGPVFQEFKEALKKDFDTGWEKLMQADKYSTRSYLLEHAEYVDTNGKEQKGFPPSVVNWFETMDSATGLYDMAFTESIMDSFDFDFPSGTDVKWKRFENGSETLITAMVKKINTKPEYNARVVSLSHLKAKDETKDQIEIKFANGKSQKFDHVISTLPLGVLRSIDTEGCEFSFAKRTALRSLHYDQSVKVGIKFRTRWWEKEPHNIKGGKSSTDLPIRTVVYPSYGEGESGVLIVSYTWSQDAARVGILVKDEQQLKHLCLSNLALMHGIKMDELEDNFVAMFAHDWYQDEFAQGAFALYGPGQFSYLFGGVIAPECNGRLHFAGEATSVHHAWIVGSLNSAYRSVWEFLSEKQKSLLESKWGTIEEVECSKPETGTNHKNGNGSKFKSQPMAFVSQSGVPAAESGASVALPNEKEPRSYVPQSSFHSRC